MKAHHFGGEFFDQLARSIVKRGSVDSGCRRRGIEPAFAIEGGEPLCPLGIELRVRCGRSMAKEVDVQGFVVCCRMTSISVRTVAASSMAQGSEPSPPAALTAIVIADPLAPAIGA